MLQTTITGNSVLRHNGEDKRYQNKNIFRIFNLNTFQISVHFYINDIIKKKTIFLYHQIKSSLTKPIMFNEEKIGTFVGTMLWQMKNV